MVSAHIDPILASILHATDIIKFDKSRNVIELLTLKKFELFQELFVEQKKIYQKYLDQIFGYQTMLIVDFSKKEEFVRQNLITKKVNTVEKTVDVKEDSLNTSKQIKNSNISNRYNPKQIQRYQPQQVYNKNERTVDVADKNKWKVTHMLLEQFGGTVREIIKDTTDEFNA